MNLLAYRGLDRPANVTNIFVVSYNTEEIFGERSCSYCDGTIFIFANRFRSFSDKLKQPWIGIVFERH